jgi:predicted ATP-grasp superfamily ATP-dependent carboligase
LDASERLLELERILASSPSVSKAGSSPDSDLVETMLGSVLTERIGRTTSLLAQTHGADVDAADLVAVRLLLADYGAAVSHLRAATRLTEVRLARAAASLKADARQLSRALDEATRREKARTAKNQESLTTTNHEPPTTD